MKVKDFFTKELNVIDKSATMYVCGPTVYDDPHIGNIRSVVVFDVLNRVLLLEGKVKYVHNITDIDDKIILKAKELNISEKEVSQKYEKEYISLLKKLNIIMPNNMPKVTDNIDGIISFINEMIKKKFAYEVNGSVYFSIKSIENYGNKGNLLIDQLIDNEKNNDKKNNKDFVIWKKTTEGLNFDSPWGKGRPGWHTECSFFVKDIFGNKGISIHGGGIDLKFPHHINEMAQYEACTKNELAKNWMYVGHVNVDSTKMSKSIGNVVKAKEFIDKYNANVLRMLLISIDYSKPIDLNENVISNAEKSLLKIKNSITKAMVNLSLNSNSSINEKKPSKEMIDLLKNNLDIPSAITFIYKIVKELNQEDSNKRKENLVEEIIANMKLLGFSFKINFNSLKEKVKNAKENSDYQTLDNLKKELIL